MLKGYIGLGLVDYLPSTMLLGFALGIGYVQAWVPRACARSKRTSGWEQTKVARASVCPGLCL